MYGTSFLEYGIYGFEHLSHAQKAEYVTWFSRFIYMAFLNRDRDLHWLDNKFEAYTLLKPFYKREAMLLTGEEDFDAFCAFTAKHRSVFVKPVNLELAEGVHRLTVDETTDRKAVFRALLTEAAALSCEDVTRPVDHRLILEEEIVPSQAIAAFNPKEMSVLRVTTILVKGKVHFFHPVFRLMLGDGIEKSGEMYSVDALIDAETGIVVTDGMTAIGTTECHPVSGLKIKGFVMPQWAELKKMLEEAALKLPTLRYIGWDVAHSEKGWCIIEGNTNGELFFQMCVGHGVKREFEDLIGFHVPYGFMLETVEQLVENRKKARS